tara:strand:- start:71 stop:706 length:636 start_codon:yes stop_codon:yes gene_type:complete
MIINNWKKVMPPILRRVESMGYKIFTQKDYDLNLIGVRSPSRTPGRFDDMFHCVYKDRGEWIEERYVCTTDASLEQHLNPGNSKGVAVLKPGQYRGAWKLDMHRGKYLALCQRNAVVTVYRDNNLNNQTDYLEEDTGMFGINIHRASSARSGSLATSTRYFSAGCQVLVHPADFARLIALCQMQVGLGIGDSFSYTLIEADPMEEEWIKRL